MRILHTSDWHIGRIFFERNLVEDQEHVLRQVLDIAAQEKVDAVVIAGDIYDRQVPPTEGIELLDHVLSELVLKVKVPTLVISGNHDSGERLAFGARLLDQQRLKIIGSLGSMREPLTLEDRHGQIDIFGIPYCDPASARVASSGQDIQRHQDAMKWCVDEIAKQIKNPSVAVAHAYVVGGQGSESERPLAVGGHPFVEASTFQPFIYTALGHLHSRQNISDSVHYCGSLLSYHFSERDVPRSVTLVELEKDRVPKLRQIPLHPKRQMVLITGEYDDILAQAKAQPNANDYVLVRRYYDHPRPDALAQLRSYYPGLVAIETVPRESAGEAGEPQLRVRIAKEKNIFDLFTDFYKEMTDQPLHEVQMDCVKRVLKAGE